MDKYERWRRMLEENSRWEAETVSRALEKVARYYGDAYGKSYSAVWVDDPEKKNPTQVPPEWGEVSP